MGLGPPKVMKNGSCSATAPHGSAALPFVISTEAKRSGEVCGSAGLSWKCFSTEPFFGAALFPLPSRGQRVEPLSGDKRRSLHCASLQSR
jgi:hypothetical protein